MLALKTFESYQIHYIFQSSFLHLKLPFETRDLCNKISTFSSQGFSTRFTIFFEVFRVHCRIVCVTNEDDVLGGIVEEGTIVEVVGTEDMELLCKWHVFSRNDTRLLNSYVVHGLIVA